MKFMTHILFFALIATSCANDLASVDSANSINNSGNRVTPQVQLERHQIGDARESFSQNLTNDPTDGSAAAGLAITELLLFPYHPTVTDIIVEDLGGSGALDQSKDVIYAEEGFLFFLAKGAPWEDDGVFTGMRTIIGPDLPWSTDKLTSIEAFVEGLDRPIDLMMDRLTRVADAMGEIEKRIIVALADDSFRSLLIPGQVFHHDSLSLNITKPDLAILRAGISATRSVVYFIAAYDYGFSLNAAFGPAWQEVATNPQDPDYVDGYEVGDYITRFLDAAIFRTIGDGERLAQSGDLAIEAVRNVRLALRLAVDNPSVGALQWNESEQAAIEASDALLGAIEESIDGATALPDFEPSVSLDLSPFFRDGRSLPAETPWLERIEDEEFPGEYSWWLTEAAYDTMFADVFVPPLQEAEPEYMEAESVSDLVETLSGNLFGNVEDVYLSTY